LGLKLILLRNNADLAQILQASKLFLILLMLLAYWQSIALQTISETHPQANASWAHFALEIFFPMSQINCAKSRTAPMEISSILLQKVAIPAQQENIRICLIENAYQTRQLAD